MKEELVRGEQEILEMSKNQFEELVNGTADQYNEKEEGGQNVQLSRETGEETGKNSLTLLESECISKKFTQVWNRTICQMRRRANR